MTTAEAGAIIALTANDSILYFLKVQDDIYQQVLDAQLQIGLKGSIEDIRKHSGMIVGINSCRFVTLLEEAKRVINKTLEENVRGGVSEEE